MIDKILLPIDGSETCQKSYDYAKEYALKFGSKVTVVYVEEGYSDLFKRGSKFYDIDQVVAEYLGPDTDAKDLRENQKDEILDDLIQKILDNAKDFFEKDNVAVETVVLKGKPADKIIDYSEENNFDMIIICTHGMSRLKRFTLGSTTNKVVHHSKVPVLVIRWNGLGH